MKGEQLWQLSRLAALRSARSAARLAPHQARVEALRTQAAELRDAPRPEAADVAQAIVRDRHDGWRADRLRRLNTQLALAQAAAQPLREAHARDRAREAVLDRLTSGVRRPAADP